MSVVFMDGFDNYPSVGMSEFALANGWTYRNYFNYILTGTRFTDSNPGQKCQLASGTVYGIRSLEKTNLVPSDEITVGFWHSDRSISRGELLRFRKSGVNECWVGYDASNHLSLKDATDTEVAISTGVISNGTGYYIETSVYCHPTAGTFKVWVNGELWADSTILYPSGINTGATTLNEVSLRGGDAPEWDDVYITNDLVKLNCPRIITLLPTGNSLVNTDWTGDYLSVDDPGGIDIATVDGTRVDTTTHNHKEGFTYESLPTGPYTVHAVRPTFRHINLDSGTGTISVTTNDGATDTGIVVSPTAAQTEICFNDASGTPATGWTKAQVDALEMTLEYE